MEPYKIIKPNMDELCNKAAHDLVHIAQQAVDERGEFNISLAGGTTPKHLYQLLATPAFSSNFPWGKTQIFFGDERNVGPDSPESNYHMINLALLRKVNVDPMRIHRIHGELEAEEAANAYDLAMKGLLPKDDKEMLEFDLVLLGLGSDGHTASLFPGTDILDEKKKHAAAVWISNKHTWRISITLPVINNARNVWVFVTGESKQDIVDRVLNYPLVSDELPIERVKPKNGLQWYMDSSAAALLK